MPIWLSPYSVGPLPGGRIKVKALFLTVSHRERPLPKFRWWAVLNFRALDAASQVWHDGSMVKRSSRKAKRDFAQNALRVVEIATGAPLVAIYHAYYNFSRVHQTLRVTPAMEAGLTDHA